jgi:hypothetical protein
MKWQQIDNIRTNEMEITYPNIAMTMQGEAFINIYGQVAMDFTRIQNCAMSLSSTSNIIFVANPSKT